MNLAPRLDTALRRLGTETLCGLIGINRLEAISDILDGGINERRLVDMLFSRYGRQILARRDVRAALFDALDDDSRLSLHQMSGTLAAPSALALAKKAWRRDNTFTKRVCEFYELDDDYLPPPRDSDLTSHHLVTPNTILFPHQSSVKDQFVRELVEGKNRLLVHMPTGAGKTRTCIEGLIDLWRGKLNRNGFILWLAHSEELCEQAAETFSFLWSVRGDQELSIRKLWGAHPRPIGGVEPGVIIASLQTLYSMKKSSDNTDFLIANQIRNGCEIVVIDEAHKATAPTYQEVLDWVQGPYAQLIGLTATPGRGEDGFENGNLAEFFNHTKISIRAESGHPIHEPLRFLQEQGFLARIRRKRVATSTNLDLSVKEREHLANFLDIPPSALARLGQDSERNACIVAEISSLLREEHQILVFACSVDHAHLLSDLLRFRDVEARCIDGTTAPADRARFIEEYRRDEVNILVNYGVLTTGFDAPNTSAIVITRPTQSIVLYSQMLGRGIRGEKVGGNPECQLVDIEDNLIGFPQESLAFNFFDDAWST